MTQHDLSPAFIEVFYHSLGGRHVATLPTRAWNSLAGTRGSGGYEAWDTSDIDALDMIDAYVLKAKAFMPSSVHFDNAIIFTKADAASPAIPRVGYAIDVAGTNAATTFPLAVQHTYTFFDTEFLPFKAVLLDAIEEDNFNRIEASNFVTDQTDFAAIFTEDIRAFSSRAGNRISLCRRRTSTLNEKLRKQYGNV